MTVRVFLALLIAGAVAVSLILSHAMALLLTAVDTADPNGFAAFLHSLLFALPPALLSLLLIALPISLAFFLIVNATIAKPLRRICRAMDAFAERGERVNLPAFTHAPREVREFASIWSSFAERVENMHTRDTEMSRMKSDFISTAAHQLRTPLTGIRWSLEALEKESPTENQRQLIKSAVDKSHDLVAIVGTLLDISSIESGKYAYSLKEADMAALAAEVVNDFQEAAARAGVSLSIEIPEALPRVTMDRDRMKWVLNNLIENGIHYTPKGGSVTVSAMSVSGRLILKVRDTGIGIPQSERNNIFERFYRAENAVTKQNQGNGLGLYIARTIVQDHGGELSFEGNTEGTGTTFTLALPT